MRKISQALLAFAFSCQFQSNLVAADHERAPIANAVGRFWGFGYSAGYHARYESRLGWNRYVPQRSPANSAVRLADSLPAGPTIHSTQSPNVPHSIPSPTSTTRAQSILDRGYTAEVNPSHNAVQNSVTGVLVPHPVAPVARTGAAAAAKPNQPAKPQQSLKPSPWLRQLLKPNPDVPQDIDQVPTDSARSPSDRDDFLVP